VREREERERAVSIIPKDILDRKKNKKKEEEDEAVTNESTWR
jgi:hypothetical protein